MIRLATGILALGLLAACTVEAGSQESDEDSLGQVSQAIQKTAWDPHRDWGYTIALADITPGPDRTTMSYQWFHNGNYCVGARADCRLQLEAYSVPDNDYGAVRAVGIAKNTSRVYAWYSDGYVSSGDSKNFTRYNSKTLFNPPVRPNGVLFTMDELIEVDNSTNGEWYYYWRDGSDFHAQIYRSTGTSTAAAAYSSAKKVNTPYPNWTTIRGIAFGFGSPAALLVYYENNSTVCGAANSCYVSSGNSLVLQ